MFYSRVSKAVTVAGRRFLSFLSTSLSVYVGPKSLTGELNIMKVIDCQTEIIQFLVLILFYFQFIHVLIYL